MKKFLTLAVWAAAAGATHAVVLTPISGGPVAVVANTTVLATAAAGSFSGNDTGTSSTIQNTLDTLGDNFGSFVPGGTAAWALWDKTDSATGSQLHTFTNNPQTSRGTLTFDSPVTGWFALTLKAGNQFSMYLFDGGVAGISAIQYSTLGTSVNHKGVAQDLSHASLWGGTAPVPEPGAYALGFAGLVLLRAIAQRQKRA